MTDLSLGKLVYTIEASDEKALQSLQKFFTETQKTKRKNKHIEHSYCIDTPY